MDIVQSTLIANEVELQARLNACQNSLSTDAPLPVELYSNRPDQQLFVVRDDYLCGGTKSRVVYPFLKENAQYQEYVYVSPWYGGAQIALPLLLKRLDQEMPSSNGPRRAIIVIDQYPVGAVDPKWRLPPFALIGEQLGATFVQIPHHKDKFKFAEEYARANRGLLLRPGFDYPEVVHEIARLGRELQARFGHFDECWCATGSGTLIRGLQLSELADSYHAVCIFDYCPDVGKAEPIVHWQGHNEVVPFNEAPPYRSALHYDAKLWSYLRARPGKILVWNVI